MDDIRAFLSRKPLLFDGGMGTYYKAAPGADCEQANLTDPAGVRKVHAEYLAAGADAITLGNHTWTRWELQPYLDESPSVLRPANYAPQCPGRGAASFRTPFGPVLVVNLLGRFTLDPNTDSPFLTADALLEGAEAKMILVDFHAEATSEKLAMGYYLDGRVSAVWGTHTHVQTSDARILPNGTGYITDLGPPSPSSA